MDTKDASSSLDTLLGGPDTAPEPVQEAVRDIVPAETGDKEQTPAPPADVIAETPQPNDEAPLVPRRALEDERRKRQEKDKALEDLQRQFNELQQSVSKPQPQSQQQPEPPDPWTDPQGALEYQQRHFQQQLYQTRLIASEEFIRSQRADYDELANIVSEEAQRNSVLRNQIFNHPFPAKLVYEVGRKIKLMRDIGDDPDAYTARVIEDWQAKNQPQQPSAQSAIPETQKLSVPKSLAGTASAQPRDGKGRWAGPASLDDILGG